MLFDFQLKEILAISHFRPNCGSSVYCRVKNVRRALWHKRIARAGRNTPLPYKENPPDFQIQDDDIVFFDFGPVFEEWEADFGRTFILNSAVKVERNGAGAQKHEVF